MMPKSKPDLCMLCGGVHAGECGSQQKKKSSGSTRKARSPVKVTESAPASLPSDSDTEDVFGGIPTATPRFKSESYSGEDRDLSYFAALRLLLPLLSPEGRRDRLAELNPPYPQSVDRRIAEWKKTHV